MTRRNWEDWMWHEAKDILREAERIRTGLLRTAAAVTSHPTWGPHVNIYETEREVWILVSLAGITQDQIEVSVEEDCLVISGIRKLRHRLGEGRYHLLEIPVGAFERRLRIPSLRRCTMGKQRLEDGILWIELRKQQ